MQFASVVVDDSSNMCSLIKTCNLFLKLMIFDPFFATLGQQNRHVFDPFTTLATQLKSAQAKFKERVKYMRIRKSREGHRQKS
jgi:hypothetical protein